MGWAGEGQLSVDGGDGAATTCMATCTSVVWLYSCPMHSKLPYHCQRPDHHCLKGITCNCPIHGVPPRCQPQRHATAMVTAALPVWTSTSAAPPSPATPERGAWALGLWTDEPDGVNMLSSLILAIARPLGANQVCHSPPPRSSTDHLGGGLAAAIHRPALCRDYG